MPSLVGLLLALRIGSLAAPAPPFYASVPIREQVHLVAVESAEAHASRLDSAAHLAEPAAPSPVLDLHPLVRPDRRIRAGDVFVALARQLHVDETPIGKVAVWVATRPVQVDWSPHHVFVRATLVGP